MLISYLEKPINSGEKWHNVNVDIDTTKIGVGAEAMFMPLDDKIGLKLYAYKDMAIEAHNIQYLSSIFGIGPDIYSIVLEIPQTKFFKSRGSCLIRAVQEGTRLYGFYTEIVQYVFNYTNDNSCYVARQEITHRKLREIQKLALEHLGFEIKDDHWANLGYKGNDLVFIDFGSHSIRESDYTECHELYECYGV